MKKHLATTAIAAALAAFALPALAQDQAQAPSMYLEGIENGVRASAFIGKRVYVTEADTSGLSATAIAEANADWDDAGEINDIIISLAGDTEAVLVDFGGFLGIGEKTVAVSLGQLAMVPDADSPQDYFIVFHGTKADLEAAPAFNPDMVFAAEPVAEPATEAATDVAGAPMAGDPNAPGEMVDLATWVDTDLIGKRVYGPGGEDVGEISAVALNADGKIEGAVVDVGGFLGIGEKKVALGSDMLMLVRDADGNAWFRVMATQDQLETLPDYQS